MKDRDRSKSDEPMKSTKVHIKRFWAIISLLVILHLVIFDLRIITAPETLRVQYVPDDGYYYLSLSRNFSQMGFWTFDSGVSTATGFHPLFAYLLSTLYTIVRPTTEGFVLWAAGISSLITLAVTLIAWIWGLQQDKPFFLILLPLLISSRNYTYNSFSVTEWPLVVLFASVYVIVFARAYKNSQERAFPLFIIGLLGSLSRSDFGLLPLSLCVVSIVLGIFNRNRNGVLTSLAGLIGACLGVLIIFAHNYIFSGTFLQSSAQMKAHWGSVKGVSYINTIRLIFDLISLDTFVALIALPITTRIVSTLSRKNQDIPSRCNKVRESPPQLIFITSAILCITGYVLFYARNSMGLQAWYSANLIVPLFITLLIFVIYFDDVIKGDYRRFIRIGISIIVLGSTVRNIAAIHDDLSHSPWPHQQFMLEAGRYLEQRELDGKVASWNAGIIGYYQGGTVINIDGLVNDDIYDYAVDNRLPSYLSQQNVRYIIDFEQMFNDEVMRLRGGYNDEAFLNSLEPVKVFDEGQYEWRYLTLYRLSRESSQE